jgi:Cu/Ag efflux protein CusF
MKHLRILAPVALAFVATLVATAPSMAQQQKSPSPAVKTSASAALTAGTVTKIDAAAARVTVQHGEIKNLNMPPMTMVFTLRNAALLKQVKVGDKVRFHAEMEGDNLFIDRWIKDPS